MGKFVLATQGDVVRLEPEAIRVNGEVVANSPTAMQDRHGRPCLLLLPSAHGRSESGPLSVRTA